MNSNLATIQGMCMCNVQYCTAFSFFNQYNEMIVYMIFKVVVVNICTFSGTICSPTLPTMIFRRSNKTNRQIKRELGRRTMGLQS